MCVFNFPWRFYGDLRGELAEKTMILGPPPGSATDLPSILSRLCLEGLGDLLLQ